MSKWVLIPAILGGLVCSAGVGYGASRIASPTNTSTEELERRVMRYEALVELNRSTADIIYGRKINHNVEDPCVFDDRYTESQCKSERAKQTKRDMDWLKDMTKTLYNTLPEKGYYKGRCEKLNEIQTKYEFSYKTDCRWWNI